MTGGGGDLDGAGDLWFGGGDRCGERCLGGDRFAGLPRV